MPSQTITVGDIFGVAWGQLLGPFGEQLNTSILSGEPAGDVRLQAFYRAGSVLILDVGLSVSFAGGYDFTAAVEENERAFTFRSGDLELVIPGPNAPSNIVPDDEDLYVFDPSAATIGAIDIFLAAYAGLTQAQKDATTLTIDDGLALVIDVGFTGGLDGTLAPAVTLGVAPLNLGFMGGLDGTLGPAVGLGDLPDIVLDRGFMGGLDGTLAPTIDLRVSIVLDRGFTGGLDGTLAPAVDLGLHPLGVGFTGGLDGTLAPAVGLGDLPDIVLDRGFMGGLDGTLAGMVRRFGGPDIALGVGFMGGLDGTLAPVLVEQPAPIPAIEFLGFTAAYPFRVWSDEPADIRQALSLKQYGTSRGSQRWRWRVTLRPLVEAAEWARLFSHRAGAGLVGRFLMAVPQLVEARGPAVARVTGDAGSRVVTAEVNARLFLPVGRFVTVGARGKVYQVTSAVDVPGAASGVAIDIFPALVEPAANDLLNVDPQATVEYAEDGGYGVTIARTGAATPEIEVVEALG